ncbi:MAG: diacylglycerol kinase catalytic region [Frankiales bacterium]|nr:diacylglycerol kinase catalytic region [Frankiales bacterium]
MRLQLVVNPAAGGGRGAKRLPAVQSALSAHDLVVTPTRSLEHADELVAAALADDRVVVAMGGDGIVGRVAGAVASGGGVMGVVPGGRGNDFCRAVGIPLDPVAACAVLTSGVASPIDLGYAGATAFIGIASIGFDSDVQERVLRSRLPLGQLVYLYGSLATVLSWKPAQFTCSVDGAALSLAGWSVAVANTGMYGGGMKLAPAASVTDGLLDVVTSSTTSRLTFLRALPKVFKGTHIDEPSVSVRTASTVTLDADRPFRVFADGDPVATLPCTITVKPAALSVILPRPR